MNALEPVFNCFDAVGLTPFFCSAHTPLFIHLSLSLSLTYNNNQQQIFFLRIFMQHGTSLEQFFLSTSLYILLSRKETQIFIKNKIKSNSWQQQQKKLWRLSDNTVVIRYSHVIKNMETPLDTEVMLLLLLLLLFFNY